MGLNLGISGDCSEYRSFFLCPCLSFSSVCLGFSIPSVLTQLPAFPHEMYSRLPSGFAMPVTKSLQRSSPAFNRCKQECTDFYLGNLPLHRERQWQQNITSLPQQPSSLPACLEGISEAHQRQGRSGQDRMHPGWGYSDRFFSSPLPAGARYISPTAIIIFAEAGSRLKNQESHNPNALAKKILSIRDGTRLFCAKIEFPPKVLSFSVYFLWAYNCHHNYASTALQCIC